MAAQSFCVSCSATRHDDKGAGWCKLLQDPRNGMCDPAKRDLHDRGRTAGHPGVMSQLYLNAVMLFPDL